MKTNKGLTDARIRNCKPPASGQTELRDRVVVGLICRVSYGGARTFGLTTRLRGRQRRYLIGNYPAMSLAEARKMALAYKVDVLAGIDPKPRRGEDDSNTFGSVAKAYIHENTRDLRSGPRMVAIINNDLLPLWRDRQIDSIERDEIKALVYAKRDKPAPAAARRLAVLIGSIFNYAVNEQKLVSTPARGIKLGTPPQMTRVLLPRGWCPPMPAPEITAYWKGTAALDPVYRAVFRLLLLTAQRRSEVAEMVWAELDLDNKLWTLPAARSKNKREHTIPLSEPALAILGEVKNVGPWVFAYTGKGPVRSFAGRMTVLRGVVGPGWRLHDIRRTAATGMGALDVSNEMIGRVLNHTVAGVTAIYNRNDPEAQKRAALDLWADAVMTLVGVG